MMDVWKGALHFLDAGEPRWECILHCLEGFDRPFRTVVMDLVYRLRKQQAIHQILQVD
jgi:hypothetical protein